MKRTGSTPVYADLNAIAPNTVREIEAHRRAMPAPASSTPASSAGRRVQGYSPHIAVSGPDVEHIEVFRDHALNIRVTGPNVGQASGLKMVYAASTKGTTALWTELLTAARPWASKMR